MTGPVPIGDIRKSVARRAEALTGVSSDELLRELGRAHIQDIHRTGAANWTIEVLATSIALKTALVQAIGEVATRCPVATAPPDAG